MKMVKSLLLGSAAGLVAVAGAQAADLPVKAKPVEYVKICSAYGAGFYYIPGTDTCLKVGGLVSAEWNFNAGGSHTAYLGGGSARETRQDTFTYQTRVRAMATFDARTQTEYGTLRSYFNLGLEQNSNTGSYSGGFAGTTPVGGIDVTYRGQTWYNRAFIQFAGLTVGKTQSFWDFYSGALSSANTVVLGSTAGTGVTLAAYTVQFGGGFSGTISFEDNTHRRTGLWNESLDALPTGQFVNVPNYGSYAAQRYPDIVANLRVDQPWGSAQVMAALHDASASCLGNGATANGAGRCLTAAGTSFEAGDATGGAVGAGVMFNLPWAKGDQVWLQGSYGHGASAYNGFIKFNALDYFARYGQGTEGAGPGAIGSFALGSVFDGVFGIGATADEARRVALTDSWNVMGGVLHYWTPALRTSVWGGISSQQYRGDQTDITTARGKFCNSGAAIPGGTAARRAAGEVCNPDFSIIQVGTRTIWSPVANLDIGLEVYYSRIDQNMVGTYTLGAAGGRPAGVYTARDQDTWSGQLRFQRNFWP